MLRNEIVNTYAIDENGIIRSAGQFEGEALYVPYFWFQYLEGGADRDDGRILGFDINELDRHQFPELGKRRRTVKLCQRDDGFICEVR